MTNEEYARKLSEVKAIQEDMEDVYHDHKLTNEVRLSEIMKLVRELGRKIKND